MKPHFSFEFFPPQTPKGVEKLAVTRKQLSELNDMILEGLIDSSVDAQVDKVTLVAPNSLFH
jgi:5,10-methylenetetrahydrofolate reductase